VAPGKLEAYYSSRCAVSAALIEMARRIHDSKFSKAYNDTALHKISEPKPHPNPGYDRPRKLMSRLEYHQVGVLTLRQTPAGFKVLGEVFCLLGSVEYNLVDCFLICSPRRWECLFSLWFPLLKELLLC